MGARGTRRRGTWILCDDPFKPLGLSQTLEATNYYANEVRGLKAREGLVGWLLISYGHTLGEDWHDGPFSSDSLFGTFLDG